MTMPARAMFPALLLLFGCSGLLSVEPPEVSLVDLQFTDLTMFETTGEFTVRLSNENPEPVIIDGGVYHLYLNGLRVGKGLSDRRIELPRLGTGTDRVTLHVSNLALATRLVELMKEPVLDYRIKTRLYLVRPYGRRRISTEHEGRIDLAAATAPEPGTEAGDVGAAAGFSRRGEERSADGRR